MEAVNLVAHYPGMYAVTADVIDYSNLFNVILCTLVQYATEGCSKHKLVDSSSINFDAHQNALI